MLFSLDHIAESVPKAIVENMMLWEAKHSRDEFRIIENGDPYTVSSQYQQKTTIIGGNMFKDNYWRYYDVLPPDINVMRIYCDTAQKLKEQNDYTVFQFWAKSPTKGIFLIDQLRGKFEAPQLESNLVAFWNKHKPTQFKPFGAQLVKIEDKSSGSSLIQTVQQDYFIPVEAVQRNRDKVLRAMGTISHLAAGHVFIPKNAEWISDYLDEFRKFSPMMTHKHDDQIDPTIDAIDDLLVFEDALYSDQSIGKAR